ncbi:unnamed protein product [Gadus morhua 'NCC']
MDPADPGDVPSGSASRWVQMAQGVHRLGVPVEGYPQNLGEVDSALTHFTAYRVTFEARLQPPRLPPASGPLLLVPHGCRKPHIPAPTPYEDVPGGCNWCLLQCTEYEALV